MLARVTSRGKLSRGERIARIRNLVCVVEQSGRRARARASHRAKVGRVKAFFDTK